jgi:hypothetical protein
VRSAAFVLTAGFWLVGCTSPDDSLPEPKTLVRLDPNLPCGGAPPPPPPTPFVMARPEDLGTCLSASFPYEAIPVEVRVAADGTARPGLGFYDQCSGETFSVDEPTKRCLEAKLSKWRWLVLSVCPEVPMDQYFVARANRPTRAPPSREASRFERWTGSGCVG